MPNAAVNGAQKTLTAGQIAADIFGVPYGDADFDGDCDGDDETKVTQTGEYEESVPNNSTWATGDWDGDREFTSADCVGEPVDVSNGA
jgi:hypothetical protein